jgi:hypothetical protein
MAALEVEPNAVSVVNNLALSYALDNKADRAEELLRNAVQTGHDDKRVRQNLALVLGLEGKFDEARQVAAVDLPDADAKSNTAYLRNMLTKPTAVAMSDGPDEVDAVPEGENAQDGQPFADKAPALKPVASAAQVKPSVETVQAPAPDAATAKVATLLPAETGSSTVAKSPAPQAPNEKSKGGPLAPAATLLRATTTE